MPRPTNPWLHLVLTVALITAAEIFLKQGAVATAPPHADWLGLASLVSPQVWIGAALLTVSFLTWVFVVRAIPLYLAFTWCSVIHVTIPLASWLVLGEKINALRWSGIALVLAGVCVIARPATRLEEKEAP